MTSPLAGVAKIIDPIQKPARPRRLDGQTARTRRPVIRCRTGRFSESLESRVLLSGYSLNTLGFFGANATGAAPYAGPTLDAAGDLFGTTQDGGAYGGGTIFEIAHGTSTLITLASFKNATSGANPIGALVLDADGNLFGTTYQGGPGGDGTIFELPHDGNGIITLASFDGTNGANPFAGITLDASGNLYGTTYPSGPGLGTVFELARASSTIDTLASFDRASGTYPQGGLVLDSSGNLYGTASQGGLSDDGTVFEIAHGSAALTTIASFTGANGANPSASLVIDAVGNLYGSTNNTVFEIQHGSSTIDTLASFDGANGSNCTSPVVLDGGGNLFGTASHGGGSGDGTVFEIASGSRTITTIASFNQTNGAFPHGGVALDAGGNLYGTCSGGGGFRGAGTVFEIAHGSSAISTLASFAAPTPGGPEGGVALDSSGNLYGATFDGAVFELPHGSTTINALALFNGTDGDSPVGNVVVDGSGNVYGTTNARGDNNDGNVFEVAAGSSTITVLASFPGGITSGEFPRGLVMDGSGNLFGALAVAGPEQFGALYELPRGSSNAIALAYFDGTNGAGPEGPLIMDSSGNIFGTAPDDSFLGNAPDGTVFELPDGSNTITALASFDGTNGSDPEGGVIMDSGGNLFGTTQHGGANDDGTVFELAHGSNTITTLASFDGTNGAYPASGVVLDSAGDLFGTTFGTATGKGPGGYGTVFEIPRGSNTVLTLASFNFANGANPQGSLAIDSGGNVYGATEAGGGTIFEVSPVATDPPLHAIGASTNATVGAAVSGALVATFTDDDPNGTASQYSASIDWGDGDSTTNSQIVADGAVSGRFDVIASKSHPYSQSGTQQVTVTIHDTGGSSDVAHGTITVTPAPRVVDVRADVGSRSFSVVSLGRDVAWSNINGIDVVFNTNVSVSASDLTLSGANVHSYALGSFHYDAGTLTAHWSLTAPAKIAADRLTLDVSGQPATGVHDPNGVFLAGDYNLSLAVLPGDATGNGTVDFADLLLLAQNYGKPAASFATGDFDADGTVTFADLLILAQNYGRALPAPAAAAASADSASLLLKKRKG